MLKIRLSRFGKKKEPRYRIIVSENSKDPWGDYLDKLGTYNPQTKEIKLEVEKIKKYIANGAQLSETVNNLLISNGVIEGKKINVSHVSNKRTAKLEDVKAKEAEEKSDDTDAQIEKDEASVEEGVKTEEASIDSSPETSVKDEEESKEEAPKEEVVKEEAEPAKEEPVKEESSAEKVEEEVKK